MAPLAADKYMFVNTTESPSEGNGSYYRENLWNAEELELVQCKVSVFVSRIYNGRINRKPHGMTLTVCRSPPCDNFVVPLGDMDIPTGQCASTR